MPGIMVYQAERYTKEHFTIFCPLERDVLVHLTELYIIEAPQRAIASLSLLESSSALNNTLYYTCEGLISIV